VGAAGASEDHGSSGDRWFSRLVVVVGICLAAAGATAVFVSSNTTGTAALLAVGGVLVLCILFRDRLQKAKLGGFEIELAVQVKDQLRSAMRLRVHGNYEESEREIQRAFDKFVAELSNEDYDKYSVSKTYHQTVYDNMEQIVRERFAGTVEHSTATDSFFPLVDAVLRLDGQRVRGELDRQQLDVCPDLRAHLAQQLTVGVTIRPGPALNSAMLVERLRKNVQFGALSATCFLLIQNCDDEKSGEQFRILARNHGMHATSATWLADGTIEQLDHAITKAILTVCSDPLVMSAVPDGRSDGDASPTSRRV
jgi:hypothetical protein